MVPWLERQYEEVVRRTVATPPATQVIPDARRLCFGHVAHSTTKDYCCTISAALKNCPNQEWKRPPGSHPVEGHCSSTRPSRVLRTVSPGAASWTRLHSARMHVTADVVSCSHGCHVAWLLTVLVCWLLSISASWLPHLKHSAMASWFVTSSRSLAICCNIFVCFCFHIV